MVDIFVRCPPFSLIIRHYRKKRLYTVPKVFLSCDGCRAPTFGTFFLTLIFYLDVCRIVLAQQVIHGAGSRVIAGLGWQAEDILDRAQQ